MQPGKEKEDSFFRSSKDDFQKGCRVARSSLDAKPARHEICEFAFKEKSGATDFITQHYIDHHTNEDL